ncbi:lysophospholipid acyltransferase family protein [Streptomyces lushanensis]|uniref:lysophospholipid acyltransferase family protein n=1 Tax=Streptomyces lushanensis TaxID=1434255 RepID=UPI000837932B|nr:lysophospholipid acyltransferase family protein [Streptomyces lushanensis]
MLSRIAGAVVPFFGQLTVTTDTDAELRPGSIIAANHTSLSDPAVVLAALRRLGVEPVVLAAAGLWRIPLLAAALTRDGHVPVRRGDPRAAHALEGAMDALATGRLVLLYGEGGLPRRKDAGEAAPRPFRSGIARLARATGAPVVPLGQAGARRLVSGGPTKQLAGLVTAPLRRPDLHVHIGAPVRPTGERTAATACVHRAVAAAWRTAAARIGEPATPAAQA